LDRHYVGFFECFNRQLFFEAHEVLEELWLTERGQPKDLFYKGLIQLAGAFVHVQKARRGPAVALLNLAKGNLEKFPGVYEQLSVSEVLELICSWTLRLRAEAGVLRSPEPGQWPIVNLEKGQTTRVSA
jgi:predicted metal-dependent hydrolase